MSGNPGGRPKSDLSIKTLAKSYTKDAIKAFVEIAGNSKATPSAQYTENIHVGRSYMDFLEKLANQEELLD